MCWVGGTRARFFPDCTPGGQGKPRSRTYHYHGFDIEVAVETDFSWKGGPSATTSVGFVAVVRISKAGASEVSSPRCVLANPEAGHFSVRPMR
jgi:hypothetical protein